MIKMMSQHLSTPNRTLLQCLLSCCSFFGSFTLKLIKALQDLALQDGLKGYHAQQDSNITWSGISVISVALQTWQGPTLRHLCMKHLLSWTTKTQAAKAKSSEAFLPFALTPRFLARATSSLQKVGWPFFLEYGITEMEAFS